MFRSSSLSSGLIVPMPLVGGMTLCSKANVALMMLVRPLTASPCPKLGLLEPTRSVPRVGVENAFESAWSSMGSPTGVPVPCAYVRFSECKIGIA